MGEVELEISPRLKKLLPPLSEEECRQLTANIETDGRVTDPILYWWDGKRNVVVDGMHRLEVARKGGFPYRAEPIEIDGDYAGVEIWVLERALGTRNLLDPVALRKLRAELYNLWKTKRGGDRKSKCCGDTLRGDMATQVAKTTGVTRRTIHRDAARLDLLNRCTPSIQKGVDTGAFKISDDDIKTLAGLPEAQQNLLATALRKGQAKSVKVAMSQLKIKPSKKDRRGVLVVSGEHTDAFYAREQIKVWADTIGRWLEKTPTIDEYRNKWPGSKGDDVVALAVKLHEALKNWPKAIK